MGVDESSAEVARRSVVGTVSGDDATQGAGGADGRGTDGDRCMAVSEGCPGLQSSDAVSELALLLVAVGCDTMGVGLKVGST